MRFIPVLLLISTASFSQMMTSAQQKALNNYVDYANQSADEVSAVVKSIIAYYPTIHQKSSWGAPRYTCPVQLEDYYLKTAVAEARSLNANISTELIAKLNDLRSAAESIDNRCKALDTYHKLEDYKQDNFAKAESLIIELQLLVSDYNKKQDAMRAALASAHKKMSSGATETPYYKADMMLRDQIAHERSFLDGCSFNLKEDVHTGWPVDKLEQSISETDAQLAAFQKFKPALKYPASSMWTNYQSSLASVLSAKRNGLDEYNFEAKKSDKHSNDVYLGLINYFNGTLVADQNAFIQYAQADGYHGLKSIKYTPRFEIRTQQKTTEVDVKPFKDIQHVPVALQPQKTALSKSTYEVLSNYIDYINETWRQIRYMKMVLVSFNSSASYYKTLDSYEKRGGMSFDYKDFQLPLSQYQKTVSDSKTLPPVVARSLNEQAEVLLNILKEMDDLAASMEIETQQRRYEKDRLKKVYEILERQKALMDIWDERKEQLYNDVRKVYDSYPPLQPANSWYVSGKALHNLTDIDHTALFEAKAHYSGNGQATVSTDKLDETLRDVIAKEYDNMKGIEKYGRYNGLCPYTPYEDLPLTSKAMSEELKKLKPVQERQYEHPYHRIVYHYNDIVDDYNKFCELSVQILHLKTIKQPELFTVVYPQPKSATNQPPVNTQQDNAKPVTVTPQQEPVTENNSAATPAPVRENIPVVREKTVLKHDTVYIERRDTVYLGDPGEDLRSMEGYATNNMVLLLDVSGSMNSPEKLPLLKSSVLELLSMMRQEDKVTIIAFSDKPKAVLTAASFKDESRIRKAINDLKSSGKTDGNAGVKLAYKVANENYIRAGNNRIILATDGEFNLNEETRQLIQKFSTEDIFLTIFNFGKGAGASRSLERVAAIGKGNYQYISKENVELQLIREVKSKKAR